MQQHDEELERYLRQFQPRAIRQLAARRQRPSAQRWWLAAAAVVVFAASIALWYARRKPAEPPARVTLPAIRTIARAPQMPMSSPLLTKLALDNREAFDDLMTAEARTVLPNMQRERSALRVLARE
jgi:hypothetical protein